MTALSVSVLGGSATPALAVERFVNVKPNASEWEPREMNVRTGDTVTWSFGNAIEDHTLTSTNDWGPDGELSAQSATDTEVDVFRTCEDNRDISRTLTKPGEYTYLCEIHQGGDENGQVVPPMVGSIRVSNSGAVSPVGASTQGKNVRSCPLVPVSPVGTPTPSSPTPGAPAATPAGPAPLVNTGTSSTPSSPPVRARTALLSGISATGRRGVVRLRFRLASASAVTARIRSVRTRKVVKTVRLPLAKKGLNTHRVVDRRRLKRGSYRVDITARDKAGRGATLARKRFTVR